MKALLKRNYSSFISVNTLRSTLTDPKNKKFPNKSMQKK